MTTNNKDLLNIDVLTKVVASISIVFAFLYLSTCNKTPAIKLSKQDTTYKIRIVERPVYIKDTIKVKSVLWKYSDTTIFVDKEIPCNDTSFIAQADSVLLTSGDTLNMAFSYAERRGNFSLVFKPRPDSIITQTILQQVPTDESYPYGTMIGTFGLGILIGVAAALSR